MTDTDWKSEVVSLHSKMTKYVLETRVTETAWVWLVKYLDTMPHDQLRVLRGGLLRLEESAWLELKRLRTLPHTNDEMWENMFNWYDRPIHDEHKLWAKAAKDARNRIKELALHLKEMRRAAKETAKAERARKRAAKKVDRLPEGEGVVREKHARE